MTLTQIKYFLEVCETRNFTRAAKNLYVAQSSLSRQIRLLEEEIGIVPSQYIEAENALFTLLYTEPSESFSIWYNEIPKNLNIYSIPEDLAVFNVCAHWANDTRLPLWDFFGTYYATS